MPRKKSGTFKRMETSSKRYTEEQQRQFADLARETSINAVAAKFGLGWSTVDRFVKKYPAANEPINGHAAINFVPESAQRMLAIKAIPDEVLEDAAHGSPILAALYGEREILTKQIAIVDSAIAYFKQKG